MFNPDRENAEYDAEYAYSFDLEFPGWEQRLAENDFYNAYDAIEQLKEIGML